MPMLTNHAFRSIQARRPDEPLVCSFLPSGASWRLREMIKQVGCDFQGRRGEWSGGANSTMIPGQPWSLEELFDAIQE
jgi:hypothetical protein